MKPKKSKASESFYDTFESPVGTLFLIFTGKSLTGINFDRPGVLLKKATTLPIKKELRDFFEKGLEVFNQRISLIKGSEFDKKIWLTLREIPYGETRTYKWLAERAGRPKASRAVGQALSRNPLPIVLPCHRIIESDGSIGGYSAGVDIKRRLLDIEYYVKLGKKSEA
ncbi:MAG: methylated-DNA--[protein]-cysteine S-methyltransferase [Nitrospirota bacterium]